MAIRLVVVVIMAIRLVVVVVMGNRLVVVVVVAIRLVMMATRLDNMMLVVVMKMSAIVKTQKNKNQFLQQ